MAADVKSIGAVVTGTGTTNTVSYPASRAANDLAVLFCASGNGGTPAAPTGYTATAEANIGAGGDNVNGVKLYIYHRVLDGAEGASVDATRISGYFIGFLAVFSGVDTADPITASLEKEQTVAATLADTNSLPSTANDKDDLFVAAYGTTRDANGSQGPTNSTFANLSSPAQTTLLDDGTNLSGGGGLLVIAANDDGDSSGAISHSVNVTSTMWASLLLRINGAGASAVSLTINNFSTGSPQLGSPTILVSHIFGINAFSVGSPTYGPVTATQRHVLSISAVSTGSPTFGPPTFSQKHSLSVANFATASPSIGTPSLGTTGTYALTIPSIDILSLSIGSPAFGQRHGLAISNVSTASPTFGPVLFSQRHVIAVPGFSTGSPELGTPAFTEAGVAYALRDKNILAADKQERVLEFARESRHQSADIEIRVLQ